MLSFQLFHIYERVGEIAIFQEKSDRFFCKALGMGLRKRLPQIENEYIYLLAELT